MDAPSNPIERLYAFRFLTVKATCRNGAARVLSDEDGCPSPTLQTLMAKAVTVWTGREKVLLHLAEFSDAVYN